MSSVWRWLEFDTSENVLIAKSKVSIVYIEPSSKLKTAIIDDRYGRASKITSHAGTSMNDFYENHSRTDIKGLFRLNEELSIKERTDVHHSLQ